MIINMCSLDLRRKAVKEGVMAAMIIKGDFVVWGVRASKTCSITCGMTVKNFIYLFLYTSVFSEVTIIFATPLRQEGIDKTVPRTLYFGIIFQCNDISSFQPVAFPISQSLD